MKITCESTTLSPVTYYHKDIYEMRNLCYSSSFPHIRKIAPTILLDVPEDSLIMKEEIFGPLLLILTVRTALPLRGDLSFVHSILVTKQQNNRWITMSRGYDLLMNEISSTSWSFSRPTY